MSSLFRHLAQPAVVVSLAIGILACGGRARTAPGTQSPSGSAWYTAQFESGSIGMVEKKSETQWSIAIRNDNDKAGLPYKWRTWWYLQLHDIPTGTPLEITVNDHGWPYYYVPVYSYDGETWHHMDESEVTMTRYDTLLVEKTFERDTVWLARFFPYTETDLKAFLDAIDDSPHLTREVIGQTKQGRDIEMLTVTDTEVENRDKKRIWIHARTHPAETGSSFLLEGLLRFLLGDSADADTARSSFVFNIVPMHNVDGVVVGNYRSTPDSINLEVSWAIDAEEPRRLKKDVPQEVAVLHQTITRLLSGDGALPITVALNLHSSNHAPDTPVFFFPHFGPEELGYTREEARLWHDQERFIRAVEYHYGDGLVRPLPAEGGSGFASSSYVETWWWQNFAADVMAITLETVYGRAGFAPKWVTRDNLRDLGRAVGHALLDYHGLSVATQDAATPAP